MGNMDWSLAPPVPKANEVLQVAGVWRGIDIVTDVRQGDCLAPAMQQRIGTVSEVHVSVQQDGITLAGTSTQLPDGTMCPLSGVFTFPTTFRLETTSGSCAARSITGLACPNGDPRELRHSSDTMIATLDGGVMKATRTVTYNLFVPGASQALSSMSVASTMRLERQ